MTNLIVLRGLPGCGKTAIAEALTYTPGLEAVHISSDAIRFSMFEHPTYTRDEHRTVFGEFREQVSITLHRKFNCVADATHMRLIHLTSLRTIAATWGADYYSFWIRASKAARLERLIAREQSLEALRGLVAASESMEKGAEPWGSIAIDGEGPIEVAIEKILIAVGNKAAVFKEEAKR